MDPKIHSDINNFKKLVREKKNFFIVEFQRVNVENGENRKFHLAKSSNCFKQESSMDATGSG